LASLRNKLDRTRDAVGNTRPPAKAPAPSVKFRSPDGVELTGHWYRPANPIAAVAISSATGVSQRFYARFAAWLAEHGVAALTFDYRGVGSSRSGSLKQLHADFSHWAHDIDGALAWLRGQGIARRALLGHSSGGFLAPACPEARRIERLVLVGAQSAYWRDWPLRMRLPMAALWHGVMPVVTSAVGYFPGRRLRLGEDLPRGVAMDWATRPWRDPFDREEMARGYASELPPVTLAAATDDAFATPAALERVARRLTATTVTVRRIEPTEVGRVRLGHFGLFEDPRGRPAWPLLGALLFPDLFAGGSAR
jgi:predicted alpha/beta hydrolase